MKTKYKIQVKFLGYKDFEDEKFLTGGKIFLNYKEANTVKKQLQNMSSNKYKLVKINK